MDMSTPPIPARGYLTSRQNSQCPLFPLSYNLLPKPPTPRDNDHARNLGLPGYNELNKQRREEPSSFIDLGDLKVFVYHVKFYQISAGEVWQRACECRFLTWASQPGGNGTHAFHL